MEGTALVGWFGVGNSGTPCVLASLVRVPLALRRGGRLAGEGRLRGLNDGVFRFGCHIIPLNRLAAISSHGDDI